MEVLPTLESGSVDAIVCDLPYGTTACKWDVVIPFEPMWAQVQRVLKPCGVAAFTAAQPFTSMLVASNPQWFRYEWVWDKVNLFTNHLNAHKRPMRCHEDVLIFAEGVTTFNRQMRRGIPYSGRGTGTVQVYGVERLDAGNGSGKAAPSTIISIPGMSSEPRGLHPTQKPVALMEYLIKTYTNEGETVLDFTMGSGTTGVAAHKTSRSFIGIEMDAEYFAIAQKRIHDAQQQLRLIA